MNLRFLSILIAGILMTAVAMAEPSKPGLIIIQGPRPEVRRYLPVKSRPEPQGHPSGWLYPATKTSRSAPVVKKKPAPAGITEPLTEKPAGNATRSPASVRPSPKQSPPALPKPRPQSKPVPVAEKIREGLVKSPYAPHVPLDVQGLPSGTLAKDPVTGKLFRVP